MIANAHLVVKYTGAQKTRFTPPERLYENCTIPMQLQKSKGANKAICCPSYLLR